jgi:hypothetical protein
VRLEWVRLEGAASCIDATELEARVRRRLGTDPFDPRATRSIEGVARRTSGVWHAQIAVRAHPADANPPLRELESRADDCDSLSNAAVLAVALAIDPTAAFTDLPPPKEPPPPPPVEPPKPPPPPPVSQPLGGRAEVSLAAQVGILPRPSLGVGLGAAASLGPRFELAAAARAFPEVRVSGDPSYAIGLVAFDLELCAVVARTTGFDLRACGGLSAGIVHAALLSGNRVQPGERASIAGELGLDAAFALTRALSFELGARAIAPVNRYRFLVEGSDRPLFEQSSVAGATDVGLQVRFP